MKKYLLATLSICLLFSVSLIKAQQITTAPVKAKKTERVSGVTYTSADGQNNDVITVIGYKTQDFLEGSNKKEVSLEVDASKAGDIYIENMYRAVQVKTWDKAKVKVSTDVYFDGENKLTDEEWFNELNITLKATTSTVKIRSGSINGSSNNYAVHYDGNVATTFGGSSSKNSSTPKRILVITIPANSKLDIENKYANIQIDNNLTDLRLNTTNGNAEFLDVANLVLRSKYSNINAGNITTAEVELTNGKFAAKNIATLDIDSKYSSVELNEVATATIRSTNDDYELEEVASITGRKNYGNLRITKLTQSIELDGSNADVKIRNIASTLKLIQFDNKYADIRIPLKSVPNYTVAFNGNYSTVYSNFEKKKWVEDKDGTKTNNDAVRTSSRYNSFASSSGTDDCSCDSKFTATVGNGGGAKVNIKCQNCTVDFK